MALSLVIADVDGIRLTLRISGRDRLTVGRAPDNAVVLSDPSVSRHHVELLPHDTRWILRDCGSHNGTFVDGDRVASATSVTLAPGTRIGVGRYELRFPLSVAADESLVALEPMTAKQGVVVSEADEPATDPPELQLLMRPDATTYELKRRLRRLLLIKQASMKLLCRDPLEILYGKVLDLVTRAVRPDRAALLIRDPEQGLTCKACHGMSAGQCVKLSRSIVAKVMDERVAVLLPSAAGDSGPWGVTSLDREGICAAMAVPLHSGDQSLGLIYVDSYHSANTFDDDDLCVLTVVADIVTIRIENSRLVHDVRERLRRDREFEAAAVIQRRLLPQTTKPIPGYTIDGFNLPCYEVGGDFFDYFVLDESRRGIVLGDVAGKGLPAAMLLMGVQAFARAYLSLRPSAKGLASFLNAGMLQYAPRNRFVTLFFMELDHVSHRGQWCNAGHVPVPMLIRTSGEVEWLRPGGQPLGILPGPSYATQECEFDEGDLLVICSDGVTDATNEAGEPFGDERLAELLASKLGQSPQQVRQAVLEAIQRHVGDVRQTDDLTVVAVRRDTRPNA